MDAGAHPFCSELPRADALMIACRCGLVAGVRNQAGLVSRVHGHHSRVLVVAGVDGRVGAVLDDGLSDTACDGASVAGVR